MDFLKRIDWNDHDGVNFTMINDFMRNQFYDRILSRYVQDQDCTDIGFGTGLLSMIALKHGARHIRAFESNTDRFQLGIEIIKQLKLQDRIELINERYNHTYTPTPITFTETVSGNLWWEGIWHSLPRDEKSIFLPGRYFLELWAVEIPECFAQRLRVPKESQAFFTPGVDVDPAFVSLVNSLSNKISVDTLPLTPGIIRFNHQQETAWGWFPYMRAIQAGKPVATYIAQYYDDRKHFVLNVQTNNWHDKTVLVVPRVGMQQDSDKLYLDTGHWGPGEAPIILHKPQNTLVVTHNVNNGIIKYSLGN